MKKKDFMDLGIDEKLAEKAEAESEKELSGYVPIERFTEADEARKKLEESTKEYEKQLEALKTASGDSEELKQKITELQEQNKQKDADYQEQLNDLRMTNAIKLAVAQSAQDSDLVAGLIDKGKLILGDDGKVTGLDEQLADLKKNKAFLFKAEETETKQRTGFRVGSTRQTGAEGGQENKKMSMKDAIEAKLQEQGAHPKE